MKVTLLTLVTLGALVGVGASLGASPPVVAKTLAVGQMKATTIHATTGAAILTEITIAPGGSFGWHEHGAPVAVIVKSGTLTVLDPTIDGCKPFKVTKGAAFVEPAHHPHLARNDGAKAVIAYALYLGVGAPSNSNIAESAPAGCGA